MACAGLKPAELGRLIDLRTIRHAQTKAQPDMKVRPAGLGCGIPVRAKVALGTPLVRDAQLQMVSNTNVKTVALSSQGEGHLAVHNRLRNRQHQGVAHCAHVGCSVLSQLPEELILSLHRAWEHLLP